MSARVLAGAVWPLGVRADWVVVCHKLQRVLDVAAFARMVDRIIGAADQLL